jgi:hypothetical protein
MDLRQVGCIFFFIARLNDFSPDTWVRTLRLAPRVGPVCIAPSDACRARFGRWRTCCPSITATGAPSP